MGRKDSPLQSEVSLVGDNSALVLTVDEAKELVLSKEEEKLISKLHCGAVAAL